MFKKIIWATDGSDPADRAFEVAKALASQEGATLVAVHSVEFLGGGPRSANLPVDADEDERQAKIEKQVAELTQQGLSARSRVVGAGTTGAAHVVAEVAEQEDADLIVCGTRGHTALVGLTVGSVTQRLLHIAPCPVLVVPPHGARSS